MKHKNTNSGEETPPPPFSHPSPFLLSNWQTPAGRSRYFHSTPLVNRDWPVFLFQSLVHSAETLFHFLSSSFLVFTQPQYLFWSSFLMSIYESMLMLILSWNDKLSLTTIAHKSCKSRHVMKQFINSRPNDHNHCNHYSLHHHGCDQADHRDDCDQEHDGDPHQRDFLLWGKRGMRAAKGEIQQKLTGAYWSPSIIIVIANTMYL